MRKIALDLGTRKICASIVVNGEVVERRTVSSFSGLATLLGPGTPAAQVAVEACREAWVICDKLEEAGHEPVLVDTTRSRQMGIGAHGRKNDRIDADVLALALDQGRIPRAHILSPARRELRGVLAVRGTVVEAITNLINSIRGHARAAGLPIPSTATEGFLKKVASLQLPKQLDALLRPLLTLLALAQEQVCGLDKELEKIVRSDPDMLRLTSVHGVGPVVAATFVSVIDDAHRFQNSHQVMSYLGLVPRETTTGGRQRLGAICKAGNVHARTALVQAAHVLLTSGGDDPIRSWGLKLQRLHKRKHAAVAVARRLAGVLWAMWRDGAAYDAALVGKESTEGLRHRALNAKHEAEAMARITLKAERRQASQRTRQRSIEEGVAATTAKAAPVVPVQSPPVQNPQRDTLPPEREKRNQKASSSVTTKTSLPNPMKTTPARKAPAKASPSAAALRTSART